MTEEEARRLLDEHRVPPRFVRGKHAYHVRQDGLVNLYRVTRSGRRIFEYTTDVKSCTIPVVPQFDSSNRDEARPAG